MTKDHQKFNVKLLEALGFVAETHQGWTLWRLEVADKMIETEVLSKRVKLDSKTDHPWKINQFELIERRGHLHVHSVELSLNHVAVMDVMTQATSKFWGTRAHADYVSMPNGSIFCVYEFLSTRRRNIEGLTEDGVPERVAHPMSGMGGFQVHPSIFGGNLAILISDYFGVGYVPPSFSQNAVRFSQEGFCLKDKVLFALGAQPRALSIQEWRISALAPAFLVLGKTLSDPEDVKSLAALWSHLTAVRSPVQAALIQSSSSIPGGHQSRLVVKGGDEARKVPYARSAVPVEVLEARERSHEPVNKVDAAMIQGKFTLASDTLDHFLKSAPSDPYLLRRLALLGISGHREDKRHDDQTTDAEMDLYRPSLDLETDNKLLLSDQLRMAWQKNDQIMALEILSRLGTLLSGLVPKVESLRTFDVIIPEMLGDAWRAEDLKKAEECYLRILQKRGDTPRILRKLTQISRELDLYDMEASYLERLSKIERRHTELAKIHLRLAELQATQNYGLEHAIEMALTALKFDASLKDAAFFAAELLIGAGRPEEAIQLLDAQLEDAESTLPPEVQSRTQEFIGRIWMESCHRPDLAILRYERAAEIDPSNIAAFRALEEFHLKNMAWAELAAILEKELRLVERYRDTRRVNEVFDKIYDVYRNHIYSPKRVYDIFVRLLSSSGINPLNVEKFIAWEDAPVVWEDFYTKLVAAQERVPLGESRGQFLCRLAEIARYKLGKSDAAVGHLKEALAQGAIDDANFASLAQDLRNAKNYSQLIDIFDVRLPMVSGPEKINMIFDYLQIAEGVSDERRDELSLLAFSADLTQEKILQRRFIHYRQKDDVDSVLRLVQRVVQVNGLSQFQKSKWMNFAIEILAGCLNEMRFFAADELFRGLMQISVETHSVLKEAINFLKNAPNPSSIVFYVGKLLELEELPDLDEKYLSRVLHGHDLELGSYQRLLSIKATKPEVAASHARIASRIFTKIGDLKHAEEMIARVCMLTPCSDDDLDELSLLVERSGHLTMLTKAYEVQIDFEDDQDRKFQLLLHLAEIYSVYFKDFARARGILKSAVGLTQHPCRVKIQLANLAMEDGDVSTKQESFAAFLTDPDAVEHPENFAKFAGLLSDIGVPSDHIRAIFEAHLERADAQGRLAVVENLLDVGSALGLTGEKLSKMGFVSALRKGDFSKASALWRQGLELIGNAAKAQVYLAETDDIVESYAHKGILLEVYAAALGEDRGSLLHPSVKKEFVIKYASMLFDDDQTRQLALPLYEEAYTLDPEDKRIWMPLYFVLNEFAPPEHVFDYLQELLPKLTLDPTPLKSLPITLEFLQGELAALKREENGHGALDLAGNPSEILGGSPPPAELPDLGLSTSVFWQHDIVSKELPGLPFDAVAEVEEGRPMEDQPYPTQREHDPDYPDKTGLPEVSRVEQPAFLGEMEWPNIPLDRGSESVSSLESKANVLVEDGLYSPVKDDAALGSVQHISETYPATFELGGAALDLVHAEAFPQVPQVEAAIGPTLEPSSIGDTEHKQDDSASVAFETKTNVASLELHIDPKVDFAIDPSVPVFSPKLVGVKSMTRSEDEQTTAPVSGAEPINTSIDAEEVDPQVSDHEQFSVESSEVTSRIRSTNEGEVFGASPSQNNPAAGTSDLLSLSRGHGDDSQDLELSQEVIDWRTAVLSGELKANLTEKMLSMAFANEKEKHLAIQAVALVVGNVPVLMESWHWRVWRNASEYGYILRGAERYPRDMVPSVLRSPLAKLMVGATNLLIECYPDKFSFGILESKLKTKARTIEKLRVFMPWDQGLLRNIGLHLFAKRFIQYKFQAYHLPGLGVELFFDPKSKSLYFDELYYQKAPPSHLFYRALEVLWMVRAGYYVSCLLRNQNDIMPVLMALHKRHYTKGVAKIAQSFLPENARMARILGKSEYASLDAMIEKVGLPKSDQVQAIAQAMRLHIFRLIIAETLNVVGFFEAHLNRDLVRLPLKPKEVMTISPLARTMLEFVTKLNVVSV